VASLSVLELFMLVSAARLWRRRTGEAVNFEMAWGEYARLGAVNAHGDRYSKAAALRAWEQLAACALLTPVDGRCRCPNPNVYPHPNPEPNFDLILNTT
jgi:hypothetical protein